MGPHRTVIDWGCGLNHSPISKQVKELPCDWLLSVDAWPEYVSKVLCMQLAGEYKAAEHEVLCGDIRDVAYELRQAGQQVDLSLVIDVLEHLYLDDGIAWLADLKAISEAVLIWVPLGYAPVSQDTYGGNNHALHTHRASWEAADLEKLGFALEVVPNAHTAIFNRRVDAGWACWRRDWEGN